jgi:segregation and condensation protein B
MEPDKLKQIVEAALLAADEPLTVDRLEKFFKPEEVDEETIRADIREILKVLEEESEGRGYEVKRVASGYRYQVRQELSVWISRLWEEKPPRYTRALLETLSLVAYKQPVTRGDIEQVRGVSVSQSIMRTLLERGWIRSVGHREVPGRPSMYGTTREFLDYFNLKSLDQLPPLAEIRALIEPLIVEEAVGEIPDATDQIADIERKMQDAQIEGDSSDDNLSSADDNAAADSEPRESASDAETAPQPAVDQQAQVVDVVTELDSPEPEQSTAEVVQLPTNPH